MFIVPRVRATSFVGINLKILVFLASSNALARVLAQTHYDLVVPRVAMLRRALVCISLLHFGMWSALRLL